VDARHKAGHDDGEFSEVVMPSPFRTAALVVVACLVPTLASAQSLEGFYRGKTVNVVIGYPPAGANDFYARAVARHIGKHIPGNPTVIPRNMPGGGSLVAANHIFNVAPKDGTTLGLIVPTAPIEEKLGAANVRFKAAQFNGIGRLAATPNVTFMNASSPVKTIKDAMEREAVLGATGRSSTVAVYPTMLNHLEVQACHGLRRIGGSDARHGARRGGRAFDHLGGREVARRQAAARQDHQHPGAIRPAASSRAA
jgi:hypothetical protein